MGQLKLPYLTSTTKKELNELFPKWYVKEIINILPYVSIKELRQYSFERAVYGYKGLDIVSIYEEEHPVFPEYFKKHKC